MDIPLAGLKERRLTQAGLTWEIYDRTVFIPEGALLWNIA
jgi:hypothetical protein